GELYGVFGRGARENRTRSRSQRGRVEPTLGKGIERYGSRGGPCRRCSDRPTEVLTSNFPNPCDFWARSLHFMVAEWGSTAWHFSSDPSTQRDANGHCVRVN